jgi:double-stranded RNA-specific adenosine deaminase
MHQIHSEGAVRHAEKRRRGTCEFANRIARISLETYQSAVPESHRKVQKQTCVAAIVASFKGVERTRRINDEPNISYEKLQVMGLGVGTKFLSAQTIQDEQQYCTTYGHRIRDCHAEVLARRAFKRQLLEEILADLQGASFKVNNNYIPILERVGPSQFDNNETRDESKLKQNTSKCLRSGFIADDDRNMRYKLKTGVTLHFYASSAPCGNATLKKFVKMEKEVFDMSLVWSCFISFVENLHGNDIFLIEVTFLSLKITGTKSMASTITFTHSFPFTKTRSVCIIGEEGRVNEK